MNANREGHRDPDRDRGAILVLTLILAVLLAFVVLAIAQFATTGLATSETTTERTESNASASAAMTWVAEEFAAKRLQPDADCSVDDTALTLPAGVVPYGTATVTCSPSDEVGNHPTVALQATATVGDVTRTIDVLLQVPLDQYTVQVSTWTAD